MALKPILATASVVRAFLNSKVGAWPAEPIDSGKPTGRQKTSDKPENIRGRLKKNTVINDRGCWIWQRKLNNEGYGIITILQKSVFAHRASYRVFVGEIPDGKILRHKCDTPACCNPDHLELGTFQQNTADAISRGRLKLSGMDNPMAKLNADKINTALALLRLGYTNASVAAELGVSTSTVSRIRRGVRRPL